MNHTKEQERIINTNEKNILCVANAGTGKTFTLVNRVVRLIKEGIKPYEILLTSFSRSANGELQNKIKEKIGDVADEMQINTIHSFCYHLLIQNMDKIPFKKLEVVSDAYLTAIILNTAPKFGLTIKKTEASMIAKEFQDVKLGRVELLKPTYKLIFNEVNSIMSSQGKITFLEILIMAKNLLTENKEVREKYARYKHIMIDECQDTNPLQFDIISLLISSDTHIMIIGDAKQNIYGFRGCSYKHMNRFAEKLDAKVYSLSETFRFGPPIAKLSNKVVNRMDSLEEIYKKETTTNVKVSKEPSFKFSLLSESAKDVAKGIDVKRQRGVALRDISVLYRCNRDSIKLQKELTALSIPHHTKSGSLLERKEIKFLTNILTLCKEFNISTMLDVIKEYSNKVDSVTLSRLYQATDKDKNTSTLEVLNTGIVKVIEKVGPKRKESLEMMHLRFIEGINRIKKPNHDNLFPDLANIFEMKETSFMDDSDKVSIVTPEDRWEFVGVFQKLFNEYQVKYPKGDTDNFIELLKVEYAEDAIDDPKKDLVHLMTIHSSKGMTIPHTYILGHNIASDFFYENKGLTPEEMEIELLDEKFLLYVALTRVSKELHFYCEDPSTFRFNFIFPKDVVEQQEKDSKVEGNSPFNNKELTLFRSNLMKGSFKPIKECKILIKTEKAVRCSIAGKEHWLPKSQLGFDMGMLYISSWLGKQINIL